jgi:hypothetical protein
MCRASRQAATYLCVSTTHRAALTNSDAPFHRDMSKLVNPSVATSQHV